MSIDRLPVFNLAMALGEKVWLDVEWWSPFQKHVIGKQLVSNTDSIAANIAEGYGRFFYKEDKQFCETKSMTGKSEKQNPPVRSLLRIAYARHGNHSPKIQLSVSSRSISSTLVSNTVITSHLLMLQVMMTNDHCTTDY